ncbi:MAG: protein-L-isoaspartate O-methyltransferase family protein [Candidatus Poseidoniales archaeon]
MVEHARQTRRLIERLQKAGVPMNSSISAAMRSVDVGIYTDYELEPFWHDRPLVFLETSKGGVKTISAPHMIAKMLYHLELAPGQEVLILGAKGGYIAALIAHIVGPEGGVVVVDPSREVVDHVREKISTITETHTVRVRKMRQLTHCPPQLPEPLDRVLVTGSLESLPNWLESRMVDGGFTIAPIGGRFSQHLVKRERIAEGWLDTDLGGVLFGPVDIADTEPEPLSARTLAELLREGAILGDEIGMFSDEILQRLNHLSASLEALPENLEPLPEPPNLEDEPPWAMDTDAWVDEIHPVADLLNAEMDWLVDVWQLLITLVDVRLMQPGRPDAEDDEEPIGGFGRHSDLIP